MPRYPALIKIGIHSKGVQIMGNESDDFVSVCAHSLKGGTPIRVEQFQAHQCLDTLTCPPPEFCHCEPVKISLPEFERRSQVSGDKLSSTKLSN
jgi:hypothetical protein